MTESNDITTEKTTNEIAEDLARAYAARLNGMQLWALAKAIEKALRDRDERAAKIAERPYSDEVAAFGNDQPSAVGEKIALAIRGQ